jgi:hypothetical protein
VTFLTQWYWLKLTRHGETVCDLRGNKKPYEVILVGQKPADAQSSLPKELNLPKE